MPTRQQPARRQPPTEPDPPARRHGQNKPVTPTTSRALPESPARARGSVANVLTKPATEQTGARAPTRIKVRATMQGYYDHIRRHEGDVFYIAKEEDFSTRWMERVAATTPERITSAPEALRRQHDALLAGRVPESGTPLVHDEPDADKNPLGA